MLYNNRTKFSKGGGIHVKPQGQSNSMPWKKAKGGKVDPTGRDIPLLSNKEKTKVIPRDKYPKGINPTEGYELIEDQAVPWSSTQTPEGLYKNKSYDLTLRAPYQEYEDLRQSDNEDQVYKKHPLHEKIMTPGTFETELHNMMLLNPSLEAVETINGNLGQSVGNKAYYYRKLPATVVQPTTTPATKKPITRSTSNDALKFIGKSNTHYATYSKPGTDQYNKDIALVKRTSGKGKVKVAPPDELANFF